VFHHHRPPDRVATPNARFGAWRLLAYLDINPKHEQLFAYTRSLLMSVYLGGLLVF
jgi:hypothetical protein